jgi:5-formyltetrahydrofolate cyclo-ligase
MDRIHEMKKELRKALLEKRKSLSPAYREHAGLLIQQHVLSSLLYRNADSIFVYVSLPEEPSTALILRQALQDGKKVYLPKCSGREMLAVRIRDLDCLVPGAYGIPEPSETGETASAKDLDLIIVPCVAASKDGKRLGHGAGYYDRFLAGGSEKTVCLCFWELLEAHIPVEDTDIPMFLVVTEETGMPF